MFYSCSVGKGKDGKPGKNEKPAIENKNGDKSKIIQK